ncbi:MAG: hypothetical protein ABI661_03575 [Gammaproteobacteria bacterium]
MTPPPAGQHPHPAVEPGVALGERLDEHGVVLVDGRRDGPLAEISEQTET